jgi:hypothetical protein
MKKATIQQPLLGSGYSNRHERSNSTATRGYKNDGSDVLYAVRAEMLQAGQVRS